MSDQGHSDGITMSGGGAYSLATIGAKHVIDAATPLVLDAINQLPEDSVTNGFTFCDMGTADAGTSLAMIGQAIDAVRTRWPQPPISIVYSDQPRNDFNALISNVHGLGSFETWLGQHDQVFPMVSGTTFYKQIVPADSLNLGFRCIGLATRYAIFLIMCRQLALKVKSSTHFASKRIKIGDKYCCIEQRNLNQAES